MPKIRSIFQTFLKLKFTGIQFFFSFQIKNALYTYIPCSSHTDILELKSPFITM